MSIVSSPASPSMVMVLRRKLVLEKSPKTAKVSPPLLRHWPRGIDAVDADFLDFAQFRDYVGEGRTATGDDDLASVRRSWRCRCYLGVPGGQRVDVVLLAGRVAVDDESVTRGAFGSAVDDVAARRSGAAALAFQISCRLRHRR